MVSFWHDGKHHVVRWIPILLVSKMQSYCFYYYIWYRTFNTLYYSCSTAPSVLEESGQVYFSCTRIPGSLLFSFSTRGTARPCLLACFASIQPRTSLIKLARSPRAQIAPRCRWPRRPASTSAGRCRACSSSASSTAATATARRTSRPRRRAAIRTRMNYSFLKMNNFCEFGNFWNLYARFGMISANLDMNESLRSSLSRKKYTCVEGTKADVSK